MVGGAKPSTNRARLLWVIAGLIGFLGSVGVMASVVPLRQALLVRSEAKCVVGEIIGALSYRVLEETKLGLNRLRRLVERLEPNDKRSQLLRAAATSAVAFTSAPSDDRRTTAQAAFLRLEEQLAKESRDVEDRLVRRSVGACLIGFCVSFLLMVLGFRNEPSSEDSVGDQDTYLALRRLSRLVDLSDRREKRTERVLTLLEATLIDIDHGGHIQYVSAGATTLFKVPTATLIGQAVDQVVSLTSGSGAPVQSFRNASASGRGYWLTAKDGSRQLVTLDFIEDAGTGSSLLFRLAGARRVQSHTLRELQSMGDAAFSDDELLLLWVDQEGRVRRSSKAADKRLSISSSKPSIFDAWSETAGLAKLFQDNTGTPSEYCLQHTLQESSENAPEVSLRMVRLRDGGWWVRGVVCQSDSVQPIAEQRVSNHIEKKKETLARVLVIDDEPAIGRAIMRALREAEVTVASGGSDGLRQALAEADQWDLVLCDIGMPDTDGVHIYNELKTEQANLLQRTVFMTGALHTERAREFVDQVNPPLILKPFDVSQIREVLQAQLTAKSTAG